MSRSFWYFNNMRASQYNIPRLFSCLMFRYFHPSRCYEQTNLFILPLFLYAGGHDNSGRFRGGDDGAVVERYFHLYIYFLQISNRL